MLQASLIDTQLMNMKSVTSGGIKASFYDQGEGSYEVLLEVNSNKILITLNMLMDRIQEFEILAVKGFVEMTKEFIVTIKKLVSYLFCAVEW